MSFFFFFFFCRLWKGPGEVKKKGANMTFKRVFVALVIFMLIFMTLIYFMSVVGGHVTDKDRTLDPAYNDFINVGKDNIVADGDT